MKTDAGDLEYKPVPYNRKKELARAMRRPGFKAAWKALDKKYAALAILLASRKRRAGKHRFVQPQTNMANIEIPLEAAQPALAMLH